MLIEYILNNSPENDYFILTGNISIMCQKRLDKDCTLDGLNIAKKDIEDKIRERLNAEIQNS